MRKPAFCICENKDADQLRGNREADLRLCFRYRIVQSLSFLNPKLHASSHLLWLYSLVCVGPGRKPRRPVFSQRGSYLFPCQCHLLITYANLLEEQSDQCLHCLPFYLHLFAILFASLGQISLWIGLD